MNCVYYYPELLSAQSSYAFDGGSENDYQESLKEWTKILQKMMVPTELERFIRELQNLKPEHSDDCPNPVHKSVGERLKNEKLRN